MANWKRRADCIDEAGRCCATSGKEYSLRRPASISHAWSCLAGTSPIAEREVRADYEFLAKIGETYYLSTMAALSGAGRARPGTRRRGACLVKDR